MHGNLTRARCWFALFAVLVFMLSPVFQGAAQAGSTELQQEVKELKQRGENLEEKREKFERTPTLLDSLVEKATFSGFIELDYDWTDTRDTADKGSDSTSDIGLGTVELAHKVIYSEWVKTNIAVRAEDVGKEEEDNDNIFLDEAILTLEAPWPRAPVYFTGGKTGLPFGFFESPLISDTLAEEVYEIEEVGATFGCAPDFYGVDISLTVYEGSDVISNLEEFGVHEPRPGFDRDEDDDVSSFIANLRGEPLEDVLTLSAFYASEPGDRDRNQSLGGALTLTYQDLTLDAQFIGAVEREKGADGEENKEYAWQAGLVYQMIKPLELAVRYEDFDDDRSGDQAETVDYRIVAGFNYGFLDFATFSFEHRYIAFEEERGSDAADDQNELHFRISVGF